MQRPWLPAALAAPVVTCFLFTALGAGIERMGLAMGGGGGASFDRAIEMERGNFGHNL